MIENLKKNKINTLTNKIVLDKNNSLKNIVIKINKQKINASKEDTKNFKNAVEDYLSTLNKKCKKFNPTLFIENFKKTNFDINVLLNDTKFLKEELKNIIGMKGTCSFFDTHNSYYALLDSIYHELMHLASFRIDDKVYLGLSIKDKNNLYGFGINEAYTQYLTEKYFKGKCDITYKLETSLIKPLEVIVGEDKLEECYFNANLITVLNKLSKYSTKEEIASFLVDYDELLNDDNKLALKKQRIQELINQICLFYLNTLKNKILTFNKYDLTSENIIDIMYLLDKNNWVKIIENKYYTLDENIYEDVSCEIREYLNFEETKKIS